MESYFESFISFVEHKDYPYTLSEEEDSDYTVMMLNYVSDKGEEQIVRIISAGELVLIEAIVEYDVVNSVKVLELLNDWNSYYKDYRFTLSEERYLLIAGMFYVDLEMWDFANSATIMIRISNLCNCCFELKKE